MPTIEEEQSDDKEEERKEKDALPAYMKKNIMAAIKKLSVNKQEDLLDSVALDSNQDF
jgi:hypothetical protein